METLKVEFKYIRPQIEIFFENEDAKFKIIPKGRRFGFTRGAAHACIDWSLEKSISILWVDTINGNIERYYERYFRPALSQIPKNIWDWNQQKKVLKIRDSVIDFRSAEQPESIEGFGYNKIILNEAGIILKDNYLYTNAILPMMMDFSDSQLIAAGVPKGKIKKDGDKHKFYELWENVLNNKQGYWGKTYSSYDNPLLTKDDILEIESEIYGQSDQEIHGIFTEASITNPFFFSYNKKRHESTEAVYDPNKRLIISVDFNLNPFAVIFKHIWRDNYGVHNHTFDEAAINNGSIPALCDLIIDRYKKNLGSCMITGDLGGKKRDLSQRDNSSWFSQIVRALNISETQLILSYNPTHHESRADMNYLLVNHPDYKINPEKCPLLCRDMMIVQCDAYGEIIKTNRKIESQKSDHADCERYACHNFEREWIERHQLSQGMRR